MLNILFYTSFNSRSRDTESLIQAFIQQGHKVFVLSQKEKGIYHSECEKLGASCFGYFFKKSNPFVYFFKHTLFLRDFCRHHKIQIVYAHLENAGLAAVLAKPFMRAKIFTCRHTVDEAHLMKSRKFIWLNKIVYGLSENTIVVSQRSKNWMVEKEGISKEKIRVLPLAYNFELYEKANQKIVEEIRINYPSKLLLLVASRMMPGKRPEIAVQICKQLLEAGLDVKLILLGDGPSLQFLKQQIINLQLNNNVFALGYQSNVMDYLSACDILIHPSLQDSSSVIIKEAGLNSKTVLACRDIGDVDEYLQHSKNAYLVSKDHTELEMIEILKAVYKQPESLKLMGEELKQIVTERFNINSILHHYNSIHQELEFSGKN